MAPVREQLSNPVTGQRIIIRQSGAETDGECLIVESVWTKPMPKPPLHYHPTQEERFQVLEGELAVRLGDTERTLKAGDELTVAAGQPHEMSPVGGGQARAVWETRPALRTEELLRTAFGLAEDGRIDRHGLPRGLQLIATGHEYSPELRLARPPWKIQRPVLALLAPLARLCGYRARYEPQNPSAAWPALPRTDELAPAAREGQR